MNAGDCGECLLGVHLLMMPPHRKEVSPPPWFHGGGGAHSLTGEGAGEASSTKGHSGTLGIV